MVLVVRVKITVIFFQDALSLFDETTKFYFQTHLEHCKRVAIKCINNCGRTDIPRDQVLDSN